MVNEIRDGISSHFFKSKYPACTIILDSIIIVKKVLLLQLKYRYVYALWWGSETKDFHDGVVYIATLQIGYGLEFQKIYFI